MAKAAEAAQAGWEVVRTTRHSSGGGVTHLEKELRKGAGAGQTATVHLLLADPAKTRLRVVEVQKEESVASALDREGALAGVNGGYFHRDRTPLGLVVMDGKERHRFEKSKLLSGVVEVTPRHARLLRVGEFRRSAQLREALQVGPYLVDKGKVVAGLNATRSAERTVAMAGKKGVVALATVTPLSLAETAKLLATPGLFTELPPVERALNLDGGSSTALWVSGKEGIKPFSRREWKAVVNALGLFPR